MILTWKGRLYRQYEVLNKTEGLLLGIRLMTGSLFPAIHL
jgi:hypothetical protein